MAEVKIKEIKWKVCTGAVTIMEISEFLWFTKKYGRELDLTATPSKGGYYGNNGYMFHGWHFVFLVLDEPKVLENIHRYCNGHQVFDNKHYSWE